MSALPPKADVNVIISLLTARSARQSRARPCPISRAERGGFTRPDPSSDRQELVASRWSHFKNQGENRFEHRSHSKNKRNREVFRVKIVPTRCPDRNTTPCLPYQVSILDNESVCSLYPRLHVSGPLSLVPAESEKPNLNRAKLAVPLGFNYPCQNTVVHTGPVGIGDVRAAKMAGGDEWSSYDFAKCG
jgi:hypothetical protein